MNQLQKHDPEVYALIQSESRRQGATLNLIAAENLSHGAVRMAQGSIVESKAAEGYPGRRFHGGCRHVDEIENLAIQRAQTIFGAEHVNVQPHSGVAANLAVYFSSLAVGDRVLSMQLSHGGHLSHGDAASMTSKCFRFQHYGVDPKTERIDYTAVADLAAQFKPKMIVAGASSYPRLIDYERMGAIARSVGALLLVDMAHIAGLVAAGVVPSPIAQADFVTFTTYKTMNGGRGGVILTRRKHARRIDRAIFPGGQGTPSMGGVAAKAVCFRLAMELEFAALQQRTLENSRAFAEAFKGKGYRLVTGGTDNHLVLVDVGARGMTGLSAEKALESVGIIVNRNTIPFDREKPDITSGIRIGSPCITTRGMGPAEVGSIVALIDEVLMHPRDESVSTRVAASVADLCHRFGLF